MHAGVFADSHETVKLERLCRYIARPAISEQRLSLTDSGKVRAEVTASQRGKNSPRLCGAPPIFEPVQTSVIDDYTIPRDFDFGP